MYPLSIGLLYKEVGIKRDFGYSKHTTNREKEYKMNKEISLSFTKKEIRTLIKGLTALTLMGKSDSTTHDLLTGLLTIAGQGE